MSQKFPAVYRKLLFITPLVILLFVNCVAQKKSVSKATTSKPKLVIGIVIDQMRWDYLYRFADRYSTNGFNRILNEGFTCENTFIPYTPTVTAAGHTCVYTGSVPALHGIMGNNWFSRVTNKSVYCTDDSTVTTVGSSSNAGEMSPVHLWSTTITDELRLASNFRSKVIGIALKDRGAILPAGHSANAAYWFDNANGAFITSTYYMKSLPAWLDAFNNKKLPDQYLQSDWNTLYPIETYKMSSKDDNIFESPLPGERNIFPHITSGLTRDKYNSLRSTPSGNTLTVEMAKAAIEGEQLGKGDATDFLAISFSSPDYIGHAFGPNSIEAEDNYLRLDRDLGEFLQYLDNTLGQGQYTLFITADHAVAHIPAFLSENKIPAGTFSESIFSKEINQKIEKITNIKNAVKSVMNYQIYLNYDAVTTADRQMVKDLIVEELLKYPVIANAFSLDKMHALPMPEKLKKMIANGYNQKLSGDIQFVYKPQWFSGSSKGTTHGSWNPYDAHIPLLWYGWGINHGKTYKETYMTDIAPTLAALLHTQMPSASIGDAIGEVIK